ncbi:unnamed protein product [Diplocarpon coronariae]
MATEAFEARALRQFDALVKRGELFWEPNTPRLIEVGKFKFLFRIAPSFKKKPIQSADDPGRSKDLHVFSDTDPDFVIGFVGPAHKLILNKYCIVRPQYILHTNVFTPQAEHLNESDFAAAWEVLGKLNSRHVVIFNCGAMAGSSLGHKHLQVLPRPMREDGFELFPDALGIVDESNTVKDLPFRQAAKRLSSTPNTAELVEVYEVSKKVAGIEPTAPHNVLFVEEWMFVIARSCGKQGSLGAGATNMSGWPWVNSEEEVSEWEKCGPMELLRGFGIPT